MKILLILLVVTLLVVCAGCTAEQWMRKLVSRIISLYCAYSNTFTLNVIIPALFGIGAFIPFFIKDITGSITETPGLVIGILSICLLSGHNYIMKLATEKALSKVDYWKKLSEDYQWVLYAISKLISRKKLDYKKFIGNSSEFNSGSILKILEMLHQFYIYRYPSPHKFMVVFLVPSQDGTFLTCLHHEYGDDQQPSYCGKKTEEAKIFNKDTSLSLAVKAWNTREPQLAESGGDIYYFYSGQQDRIKSMIAVPVFGKTGTDVVGIITIATTEEFLFKQQEKTFHCEIINEFGIRIALEFMRLKEFL